MNIKKNKMWFKKIKFCINYVTVLLKFDWLLIEHVSFFH